MICKTKIHIRFSDIDSMGHVNNAIYLSYFEQARMDYFAKRFAGDWDWKRDGIVLVKNEIEYKLPIFLNDNIRIETIITQVGNKSFTFGYKVFKATNDSEVICSTGSSILVAFDYKTHSSKPIPEHWKKVLSAELE